MIPQWIIEKKRDGAALTDEEIRFFMDGYTRGDIPDYQAAALAMAVYFSGMTLEETASLTDAMIRSGRVVNLSSISLPKADKHSTGGIGDKVSLVLAPLAACCGMAVPMISGRGLGITGGTLDKLESIPGYRVSLGEAEFAAIVRKCGCSIIGQTEDIAPADKKMYALRDVTGTVPSIPLITASILSKKLAEGIDCLVMDVKCGAGAFMKTIEQARALAASIIGVGTKMGKKVSAIITDMNEPLGSAVGNAIEVWEAIECLRGKWPEDMKEVTLGLAREMLSLAGIETDAEQADHMLSEEIGSGRALEKFAEMVRLHGGNAAIIENKSLLPGAETRLEVAAASDGFVVSVNAELIGKAALLLGAGRTKTSDNVDLSAGVEIMRKRGNQVARGEILAVIHGNRASGLAEAEAMVKKAFEVRPGPPGEAGAIIGRMDAGSPGKGV